MDRQKEGAAAWRQVSLKRGRALYRSCQRDLVCAPPAVSLPKGGGAIRGIGEKFSANPATGTGSLTIPLPVTPGRSGFGPSLALRYDSGAAHGPFGMGWSIGLPSVTRKTDKGLPTYNDAAESDVFILSDAQDLVPVLAGDGTPQRRPRTVGGRSYLVTRYRARGRCRDEGRPYRW